MTLDPYSANSAFLPRTLVFIDAGVDDLQTLVAGVPESAEVVVLDAARDGIRQMAQVLAGRTRIESLHIVSHGAPGRLVLGTAVLDAAAMGRYRAALAVIGAALAPDADILLYGCDVARGDEGVAFVEDFAAATGAAVAASATRTGAAALGGDWDLPVRVGPVATEVVFSPAARATYAGVLTPPDSTAPTLSLTVKDSATTRALGATLQDLFDAVTASTVDAGQTFSGMVLTVHNLSGGSEFLTIGGTDVPLVAGSGSLTAGNYSVTVAGNVATVTLSGMALSNAAMGTLVDGIGYKTTNTTPGMPGEADTRSIVLRSITDNGSTNATTVIDKVATVTIAEMAGSTYPIKLTPVNQSVTLTPGVPQTVEFTVDITSMFIMVGSTLSFTPVLPTGWTYNNLQNATYTGIYSMGVQAQTLSFEVTGTGSDASGVFPISLKPTTTGLSLSTSATVGSVMTSIASGLSVTAVDASKTEGNSGSSAFVFAVTREGDTAGQTTVQYAVTGAGIDATDFVGGTLPSGTITLAAGETSALLTLYVAGDTTAEADEALTVVLSNPSAGMTISTATAAGSIINDDASLSITATDANKAEGHGGTTAYTFTVTRDGATAGQSTVQYAVTGAAVSGSDFVGGSVPSGTITFAAGATSALLTLNVAGDITVETDEAFSVVLSNASGAAITTATAAGTIRNDDASLSIAATDADKAEGNSGTTAYTFTVTRTGATAGQSTVQYAVTGAAVSGSDFVGGSVPSGTITFAAGATSALLTLNVAGDTTAEGDEAFSVVLSNPSTGATIATATAAGTIRDDDVTLAITATDANKAEGDSGTTAYTFTVTRTGGTAGQSTVQYTATGAGLDGSDFVGGSVPSGTITFGTGQTTALLTLNVAGDTVVESNEAFSLVLSNASGAAITTATATGTIINDDASLSIAAIDADKLEDNSGTIAFTFTVTRTGDTAGQSTVQYAVTGAGLDGSDFVGGSVPSGTITFAAGATSALLTLNVAGDTTVETDETFSVVLSNAGTGATIATATAAGTIFNDDASLSIAATDADKWEGHSGTTAFTFTVTRAGDTAGQSTVQYAVTGAAVSGSDFVGGSAPSGTITFAAGETSALLTLNVAGDATVEGNEAFSVVLSNASAGTVISTGTATGTIRNDDFPPPEDPPPATPTTTQTVDGVTVQQTTQTNGDGTTTQTLVIPIVTTTRTEQVASTPLADIPLARDSSGQALLEAHLPVGVGMQVETTSTTTGSGLTGLIQAIQNRTQNQPDDKNKMTDVGQVFLNEMPANANLTVRTIVPVVADPAAPPTQPIVITGTSSTPATGGNPGQQQAVVIDVRSLPKGTIIQLQNVEFAAIVGDVSVTGGEGSQVVVGDSGNQFIVLGADDDTLRGGGGNDFVGSEGGNDMLWGDEGLDTVTGGIGNDVLYGNQQDDVVYGNQGFDTLFGGQDADTVFGGQDGDVLYGNRAADVLYGNLGADTLFGGQDNDVLFGGQGNDLLAGNLGADTLTGGLGADVFRIGSPLEGGDVIADFEAGVDKIAVVGPNFGSIPAGPLSASHFALDNPTTAGAAFVFNTRTGVLSFDADGSGSGAAVTIATLNVRTLSHTDILVLGSGS
ncbi:DUF4347 domain-containing protein [Azospirillum sp.]|uniref:DUF4347 domain-containing protein n=1 Tax=Azospirillum sp. TaxID=34012 RepID=UPI002D35FFEE|nr:DUF4347 domain-containing protein [Azospirillum sp.]HYD71000.1 DUF4347 domain-containing protein [Azospirillum sp.]